MAGAVLRKGAVMLLALLLAAFFGFVGWNKAFAPLAELAHHGAWTVHLPEGLGRLVGWSELALAAALLAVPVRPSIARIAALALVLNQIAAALVHGALGETAALPQNAVLIVMLLALWGAAREPRRGTA